MTPAELERQRRLFKLTRPPSASEYAELLGLVRLLASYGCVQDGPDCRREARKTDLCGPCHARALLGGDPAMTKKRTRAKKPGFAVVEQGTRFAQLEPLPVIH